MQAVTNLELTGELDAADAPLLAATLDGLLDAGWTVTVDVGAVTFLDSDIVRVLRDASCPPRSLGPVRVVNASALVRRTFEMTGWGALLTADGPPRGVAARDAATPAPVAA